MIDCPPSLDQLTINALTAAHGVAVVTQSKLFSSNGTARLLDTIRNIQHYYQPALRIAGLIINAHEERTISGQTWLAAVQEAATLHQLPLLMPPIPKKVAISDATEAGQGLDEWNGAEAKALADLYTALNAGKSVGLIATLVATVWVPPLPGAMYKLSQSGLWCSFTAKACSRPPEPRISMFISIN